MVEQYYESLFMNHNNYTQYIFLVSVMEMSIPSVFPMMEPKLNTIIILNIFQKFKEFICKWWVRFQLCVQSTDWSNLEPLTTFMMPKSVSQTKESVEWNFTYFLDTMESGSLNIAVELKSNKENVSVGDQLEFELEIDPEMADTFK